MSVLDNVDAGLAQGIQELLQFCADNGLQARITSGFRTRGQQQYLYNRYINGNSMLPAVPPDHSAHEYGWAVDLVVTPNEYQQAVGEAWVKYWGGSFGGRSDPVHFELPGAGAYAFQLGEETDQKRAIHNPPMRRKKKPRLLKARTILFSACFPVTIWSNWPPLWRCSFRA